MSQRAFLTDTRGVSSAVSYTLAVAITVVLVGGLVFSMSGLLAGQTDRATETELRTVAEGIATEVSKLDTVIDRADGDVTLATRIDGPAHLVGDQYTVTVLASCPSPYEADRCLRVSTSDRSAMVPLTSTAVDPGSVTGGTLWLVADNETITLTTERPS